MRVPTVPPTTTTRTVMRKAQRMTSTKVKRARWRSFAIRTPPTTVSLISLRSPPSLHWLRRRAARAGAALRETLFLRSGLRPDLLRVRADLEGLGIGVGVLVDGGLELGAFAVLVTSDGTADPLELRGEDRVTQRLAADIDADALVVLRHLLDRLEGEHRAVIGVGVIARDRQLAKHLLVLFDELRIALAHRL